MLIYGHAKNLKDLESEVGTGYYINDQLSEQMEENKRQLKTKYKINQGLVAAQRQNLEWKRGQLQIDGVEYRKKNKRTNYQRNSGNE